MYNNISLEDLEHMLDMAQDYIELGGLSDEDAEYYEHMVQDIIAAIAAKGFIDG